jgi:hypothetical protein
MRMLPSFETGSATVGLDYLWVVLIVKSAVSKGERENPKIHLNPQRSHGRKDAMEIPNDRGVRLQKSA